VFVDHEPGRLAHLDAERWRLERAEATRVTATAPAVGRGGAASAGVVEIEVGVRPGAAAGLAVRFGALPGVRSVRRDGERVIVAADPGSSDAVLRQLLAAGDGVHVQRLGPEPAPSAQAAGEGDR